MSLYKRPGSPFWWIRFTHRGQRVQKSTGTVDRTLAQQYHDRLKSEAWAQDHLAQRAPRFWEEAVTRFLKETVHKASHGDDIQRLRWIYPHLAGQRLDLITRDTIARIGEKKRREAAPATANRHLAIINTILRRACHDWEWIDKAPRVRLFPEPKRRIRFLTPAEAQALLAELPEHQAEVVRFALATGLRQANVLGLQWSQVDEPRRVAWIHPDQAKGRHAIAVPLNPAALEVLARQRGRHKSAVFTYLGKPIKAVNTKAWQRALVRAGIQDFRWHDLRHTWASWHLMAGTSTQELQELAGWQSTAMVRRYAHLSATHLAAAAARIALPDAQKLLQRAAIAPEAATE